MILKNISVDEKINNLQGQIDVISDGDSVFKGYVHQQFEVIAVEMVTKEDLRSMERRLWADVATRSDLNKLSETVETMHGTVEAMGETVTKIAKALVKTNETVEKMGETVTKIAKKVGVSP